MAVQTPIKLVGRRLGDSIRRYAASQGWSATEIAIAGTIDDRTDYIQLLIGSVRPLDKHCWYAGIMEEFRHEFVDFPYFISRVGMVIRNVPQLDQIYLDNDVAETENDITNMLEP